jgi:nucleoside-diphosphate-sugar epimerase
MKVLVTGGTGVVGTAAVRALLAAGHSVRLLSRHATRDAERWGTKAEASVEAHDGSVASSAEVFRSADGCDAILHIAGIAEEHPPESTFERVNVGGTANLIQEGERAGVKRFVYVSSLGADSGTSPYHQSKLRAEGLVQSYPGDWLICRPGNVYGPGDEVVSFLLQILRASPAVPVIDGGNQPFQPLYAEDLGAALAIAVERSELKNQVLLLAGSEVTSTQDLLDRLAVLTGRDPVRVPVPSALASLGATMASLLGVRVPVDDNKVTMLLEENVIPPGAVNALTEVLGVQPTPLNEGLRRLTTSLPEQLPDEGTGPLVRRIFHGRLLGVTRSTSDLFTEFRRRFFEIVPEGTMGDAGELTTPPIVEQGNTLTLSLPMRGHVQVRVAEVTDTSMTYVTVAGHPLAGAITFRFVGTPGQDLRFEIETCDRPATTPDAFAMFPLGTALKRANWIKVVRNTAAAFGAPEPEVQTDEFTLGEAEEKEAVAEMRRKVDALARQAEPELQDEAKEKMEAATVPGS